MLNYFFCKQHSAYIGGHVWSLAYIPSLLLQNITGWFDDWPWMERRYAQNISAQHKLEGKVNDLMRSLFILYSEKQESSVRVCISEGVVSWKFRSDFLRNDRTHTNTGNISILWKVSSGSNWSSRSAILSQSDSRPKGCVFSPSWRL